MKYGLYAPNFGKTFGDPNKLVELAEIAEQSAWQGFFLWDHILTEEPTYVVDPWIALTAMASKTDSLILGTSVTPSPRRDPSKLIRETLTLQSFSGGRLILGLGLGIDDEFRWLGHEPNIKIRAKMQEEQLEILSSAWKGEEVNYQGDYYNIEKAQFLPEKATKTDIPIWFGGTWPNKKPFRRAARWGNGIIPLKVGFEEPLTPDEIQEVKDYTSQFLPKGRKFDIIKVGFTPREKREEQITHLKFYEKAGITWFLETIGDFRGTFQDIVEIIERGPILL